MIDTDLFEVFLVNKILEERLLDCSFDAVEMEREFYIRQRAQTRGLQVLPLVVVEIQRRCSLIGGAVVDGE